MFYDSEAFSFPFGACGAKKSPHTAKKKPIDFDHKKGMFVDLPYLIGSMIWQWFVFSPVSDNVSECEERWHCGEDDGSVGWSLTSNNFDSVFSKLPTISTSQFKCKCNLPNVDMGNCLVIVPSME